jgi:bifunctional non-homologous end joining protein LigD
MKRINRRFERPESSYQPPLLQMPNQGELRFAFRRHQATRLHTDIRLEAGDLLSFVIDGYPSLDPSKPVRAILMEDHDPQYLLSERRIPIGMPGAGPTMVWDHGTYSPLNLSAGPLDRRVRQALDRGLLDIRLYGRRLKGAFRFKVSGPDWLLVKLDDEFATLAAPLWEDISVVSGRRLSDF